MNKTIKQTEQDFEIIETISFQAMKYLTENAITEDDETEGEAIWRRLPHYITDKMKDTKLNCSFWSSYSSARWKEFWDQVEIYFEEMK